MMKSLLIKVGYQHEDFSSDLMDLLKLGVQHVEYEFEISKAIEKIGIFRYENIFCDTNVFDIFKKFGAMEIMRDMDGRIIGLLK